MEQRRNNTEGFGATVKRGWKSKPTAIAAIAIVVVLVLVVLVSTLLGVFAPANNDNAAKPAASTSAGLGSKVSCDVPTTGQAKQDVPSDLSWHAGRGGITWPVSAGVGPTKDVDGFPGCFARTPTGAALAATTAYFGQYDTGHSVQELLNFYIDNGPGKSSAVDSTAKEQTTPEALRAQGISVAGYSVESFTKNQAVVDVVLTKPGTSTGYFAVPLSMTWVSGDWKLSVLANGALYSGNPLTPATGDFTDWGGSNG